MSDFRSNAIKPSELKDLPLNEIFKGFPERLKNPKMYEKVERDILNMMYSDHKHRKIKAFVDCKRCKAKVDRRKAYLTKTGFKDYHQYLTWKKVMVIIKDKLDEDEEKATKTRLKGTQGAKV